MTSDMEATDSIRYNPPRVMTLEEVAVYLGFAPATIRRLLRDREIPAAKVAGQWRFLTADVDRWLEGLATQTPQRFQQLNGDEVEAIDLLSGAGLAVSRDEFMRLVEDFEAGHVSVARFINLLQAIPEQPISGQEDMITRDQVLPLLATLPAEPFEVFEAKLERVRAEVASQAKKGD